MAKTFTSDQLKRGQRQIDNLLDEYEDYQEGANSLDDWDFIQRSTIEAIIGIADAPAWTPVTEATMPPERTRVQLTDGESVESGEHSNRIWYDETGNPWRFRHKTGKPTHWMPLPAPPEQA